MYKVTYKTVNDIYTKSFTNWIEANRFCQLIAKLYPDQRPIVK